MITTTFQDAIIDISEDNDLTAEIDLGRPCDVLLMIVPTITNAQISVKVSENTGGTFQDLYITDPADGGNNKIISATSTGNFTWVIPFGGFRYFKIATSAAQLTTDKTFRVAGVRS